MIARLAEPLRVCRYCGFEAHNLEDLELFVKSRDRLHGRVNLCKSCFNKYRKHRRNTDDSVYLKHKFRSIIERCYYINNSSYSRYGALGIIVCDEWLNDPDTFIEWALGSGWKRELTIDRINSQGTYSPSNCRWVTTKEQSQNKTDRRDKITFLEKGTRICSKCKVEKPLTEFHRDNNNPHRRRFTCKECRNALKRKKNHEKKSYSTHRELTGSQSDSAVSSKGGEEVKNNRRI